MTLEATTARKVQWLRENRHLWENINWKALPFHQYRSMKKDLVELMKREKLYSPTTNACDINIIRLIELALVSRVEDVP